MTPVVWRILIHTTSSFSERELAMSKSQNNLIELNGESLPLDEFVSRYKAQESELKQLKQSVKDRKSRQESDEYLKPFQAELIRLQKYLEDQNRRMIILFEGRDAAGKGGTIRRVTRYMNEKHYRIVALGKPSEEQRTQWYYQKYISQFPRGGEIVLFDRSWYNRAMVERVFGFCDEDEYENFMGGVAGFERDLVRNGTILLKLYFSVTKDEQARRFERRRTDPLRQWKLSEVDLQAQDRWDEFTDVKYEMLKRTNTIECPWTIIRSNDKSAARANAIKVILNSVNYGEHDASLDYVPDPKIVISGARELELMEAQKIKNGAFFA